MPALAESCQPLRRMDNQMGHGPFQIAVLREEDSLIPPQAIVIEIGYFGQRIITVILVINRYEFCNPV